MLKHIRKTEEWQDKNIAQKGFTLVELLVVISILGILAAVVVFAVSGINDRGQSSACKEDARSLRTAVEVYRAQNPGSGSVPAQPTQAQLVTAGSLQNQSSLWTLTYGTTAPYSPVLTATAGSGGAAAPCAGVTG